MNGFEVVKQEPLSGFEVVDVSPITPTREQLDTTKTSTINPDIGAESALSLGRARRNSITNEIGSDVNFNEEISDPIFTAIRADLSFSDKIEEKQQKLNTYNGFDKAVLKQTKDGDLFIKKTPDDVFVPYDNPDNKTTGELINDFADMAGVAPEIAGQILATKGAGFLVRALTSAAGSALGFGAGQGVDAARGFQQDTLGDVVKQSAEPAAVGFAGEAVGQVVKRGINAALGRGFIQRTPEQNAIIQAFDQTGVNATVGQLTTSPLLKTAESFSGRIGAGVSEKLNAQKLAAKIRIDSLVENIHSGDRATKAKTFFKIAKEQVVQYRNDLSRELEKVYTEGINKTTQTGGKALIEGREAYIEASGKAKDSLYTAWRQIAKDSGDDITFSMPNAQKSVTEIERKVLGTTSKGDKPANADFSSDFNALLSNVKDFAQHPQDMEVLKELRTRANDFASPDSPRALNRQEGMARRLASALSDDLTHSFNSENKALLQAFKKASDAHRIRQSVINSKAMVKIAKEEAPERLVPAFAKPNNVTELTALKKNMLAGKWLTFQDSAVTWLARSPQGLKRAIEGFDKETLNVLFPKKTQELLTEFSKRSIGLEKSALAKTVDKGYEASNALAISPKDLPSVVANLGGKETEGGRILRSGFIADMLKASTKTGEISPTALESRITAARAKGLDEGLFTEDDLKVLDQMVTVLKKASDKGGATGLAGSSLVANLIGGTGAAFGKALHLGFLARAITSKTASKLLFGTTKRQITNNSISTAIRIMFVLQQEQESSEISANVSDKISSILGGLQQ